MLNVSEMGGLEKYRFLFDQGFGLLYEFGKEKALKQFSHSFTSGKTKNQKTIANLQPTAINCTKSFCRNFWKT